ncbi:MAG: DNA polymerase III subunit delta' [Deltaproteobacteria bacterium]|nr:DNA polymerase III subunit delta' [Deltaproteobacteria bacterium]
MRGLHEVLGQDRAIALLRRALAAGKVPHAYLFAGPSGVGKRTAAVALARALNCERAQGAWIACGSCTACEKIASGNHPDLLFVRPSGAGNFIAVGDVRELIARLSFAPHEGSARVVVVEDADRLRPESANAFLKTLEEPPLRTHFVLITASPDALLVTIRSRCQRVGFLPLSASLVTEILTASGTAPETARTAAALGGGSVSRAMEYCQEDALERRHKRAAVLRDAVRGKGIQGVIHAATELAAEKEEIAPTLELLALWYRDAAGWAAGLPKDLLVHRDQVAELGREAASGAARLAKRASVVLEAQAAILGFASPQLALEQMILALREG